MAKAIQIELTDDEFEARLTEAYGEVNVCGMTMDAGRVLREMDITAFDCMMADEPEQWQCDDCKKIHDTEDDARECCPEDEDETE